MKNFQTLDPFELVKNQVRYHNEPGSDVKIVQNFFKDSIGRFLVIGACNGQDQSWQLLEQGWSGVYCEPDPFACVELINNVKKYKNQVLIVNSMIATATTPVDFYLCLDEPWFSSAISGWAETHATEAKTQHLISSAISFNDLLNKVGKDFDYVQIDTEGMDIELISSIDWTQMNSCKMICTEAGPAVFKQLYKQGKFMITDITSTNTYYCKL